MSGTYKLIFGIIGILLVTLIVLLGPSNVTLIVLGGLVVALLAVRPAWSFYIALILGLTAFPAAVPYSAQLGATTIFLYEPFLFVSAFWAVMNFRAPEFVRFRTALLSGLLVVGGVAGLARSHPPVEVVSDGRGLLTVLLTVIVVSRFFGTKFGAVSIRVLLLTQWTSLAVIVASMFLRFPLAGRTESAALFLSSSGAGSSDSTRYLTAASQISVLVFCASLALVLAGRVSLRRAVPYVIPSFALMFLSFSRNSFLAIAVSVLVAIILSRSIRPAAVMAKAVLFLGPPAFLLTLGHLSLGLPGGDFILAQVDAFTERVLNGLDSSTLADDTSAIARANENVFLIEAFKDAPFFGHGFGYAYRPAVGPPGSFSATKGQYYGHNFYLWIAVKAGLLGLLAFLVIAAAPVFACFRRRTTATLALGSSTAGLLVAINFAPFPNDVTAGGSLSVGLLVGALLAALVEAKRKAGRDVLKHPTKMRTVLRATTERDSTALLSNSRT